MIEGLEAIQRGDIQRLAIFMPPGSAKSTYASVLFPPWMMQCEPGTNVLAASHTTELAEKWGRRVRNLIVEHAPVLGLELSSDSHAAGRWALKSGAEYYAAGVGTGIAGFRAKIGLIDDPIRSRQDADSELIRNRIWDWYINDFRTRLVPGAREILIQTRWSEDDLAGRALNHLDWHVISLPALARPGDLLGRKVGEPLWSDGDYGYGNQLVELSKSTPARTWSALYQQEPAPDTGDYFHADWLKPYVKAPARDTMMVYGASDYAVSDGENDYTVHVVVGVDPEDRMYLLDLWRQQASSDKWVDSWCDLVKYWKPIGWAEEKGQIEKGVGPFRDKEAMKQKAYCASDLFPTSGGDKSVRAQSIRGRMAKGGLYVPIQAPWYADLRSELLAFPAGKHDDQVDALGLLGQLLAKMVTGRRKIGEKVRAFDGYSDRPETTHSNNGILTL